MPASKKPCAETFSSMVDDYQSGLSFQKIGLKHGMAKNTVRHYIISAGIEPDRRRSLSQAMTGKPGGRRGKKASPDTLARMSAARKGHAPTRTGPHSEETKRRISDALLSMDRKRFTAEERSGREKLRQACRRFIRRVYSAAGLRKSGTSQQIVGYSTQEMVDHLGPRGFDDHVDHIVPIAEFARRGIFDPAIVNALPNLRWLGAHENRVKSASVPSDADARIAECIRFANSRRQGVAA